MSDPNRRKEVALTMLTRLRFGHSLLHANRFRFSSHPDGLCDKCFESEDIKHVLFDCVFNQPQQSELVDFVYANNLALNVASSLTESKARDKVW